MADNSSKNKLIAKNTAYMYLRMLLTMTVAFYTVRVVVNTLGHEDYGLYGVIGGLVATLSVVSNVLANASQRFFAIELGKNDLNKLNKVFSSIIILYSIICLILLVFAETIGLWFVENKMTIPEGRMECAIWVYHFSVASFLLTLLFNPFQAIIIAHENMNLYAYISILDVSMKLGIVYLLVHIDMDKLKLYSLLMFSVVVIVQLITIIYSLKKYPETHVTKYFDSSLIKSIGSYCSWTLVGSLAYICNTQGLNIIFNIFFGPIVNAAYSIANQIKTQVVSFGSNFFSAVRPAMTKSFAAHEYDYSKTLFFFSTKVIFSLLFIIMLPLIIEIDFVLHVWLGNVAEHMSSFTRLMLIFSLILCISEPITTIVQAAGLVKRYHICVDCFTLVTLPVSYIFFKYDFYPEIAFYISIVIFIIAHYIRLVVLKRIFPITISEYNKKIIFPVGTTIIICSCISFCTKYIISDSIISFFSVCAVSFVSSIILIYFIVLSKQERAMAKKNIFSKFTTLC